MESFDAIPAVAALISSRLIEDLTKIAADQRSTSVHSPACRMIGDLDVLVDAVHRVVDVERLDSAVRAGICEVADYAASPSSGLSIFLQGVDALPAHIGADFDVIRPVPSRAAQIGLEQTRYILITGPSGAGKSAQMWRSARDFVRGAQVVRVHRLETDHDVEELIRYVRLLEPRDGRTVVVCCDDLGRPRTALWPLAVHRLLELCGVVMIGAVRREDFTAELLRGGQLVELLLDNCTAETIALQLEHVGVSLALEVAEAVNRARGQLMEYVSLLTTGRRLQAVLASQAESLLNAPDQTGANIARLICGAHTVGVSIDASDLERGMGCERVDLTRALRRLQDEHIITTDDQQAWRGLHERRSEVLTELLHKTPPPTRRETLDSVLSMLRPASVSWALRRITELFDDIAVDQRGAIRAAARNCKNGRDIAILFEGLERVDHTVTARKYTPVIKRHRHPRMSISGLTLLACADNRKSNSEKLKMVRWIVCGVTFVHAQMTCRLVRRSTAMSPPLNFNRSSWSTTPLNLRLRMRFAYLKQRLLTFHCLVSNLAASAPPLRGREASLTEILDYCIAVCSVRATSRRMGRPRSMTRLVMFQGVSATPFERTSILWLYSPISTTLSSQSNSSPIPRNKTSSRGLSGTFRQAAKRQQT